MQHRATRHRIPKSRNEAHVVGQLKLSYAQEIYTLTSCDSISQANDGTYSFSNCLAITIR